MPYRLAFKTDWGEKDQWQSADGQQFFPVNSTFHNTGREWHQILQCQCALAFPVLAFPSYWWGMGGASGLYVGVRNGHHEIHFPVTQNGFRKLTHEINKVDVTDTVRGYSPGWIPRNAAGQTIAPNEAILITKFVPVAAGIGHSQGDSRIQFEYTLININWPPDRPIDSLPIRWRFDNFHRANLIRSGANGSSRNMTLAEANQWVDHMRAQGVKVPPNNPLRFVP